MIEHMSLMEYVSDEDDYPVYLCLCVNGKYMNWKDNPPFEVLYIPENMFNNIFKSFIYKLGLDYYGSVGITNELESLLRESLKNIKGNKQSEHTAHEILSIIDKAKTLADTHYLLFEGP